MPTQFKNMNELVEYLNGLEQRVQTLEAGRANQPAAAPAKAGVDEDLIAANWSGSLRPAPFPEGSYAERRGAAGGPQSPGGYAASGH